MSQTINLTVGAIEYTLPIAISETAGKDISDDTILMSLGTWTAPGAWLVPDLDPAQAVDSQRVVQLLIGATFKPVAGTYYLWTRVADLPELVPRRHGRLTIV